MPGLPSQRLHVPQCVSPKALTFEPGEMSRLCREAIRDAKGEAISADDIVVGVMRAKGLDPDDRKLRQDLLRRFLWALHPMHVAGTVRKIGHGQGARWASLVEC